MKNSPSLACTFVSPNFLFADNLQAGVDYEKPVDIFAVGFEEIVDLNASNIMSAR